MERKKRTEDSNAGFWLTTYSDLVTLLLCFFVLLFAMSTIDKEKFKKIILSFQSSGLSVLETGDFSIKEEEFDLSELEAPTEDEEARFREMHRELEEFLAQNGLSTQVSVFNQNEGLLIRFNEGVLFDKGDASLKTESIRILRDMAPLLHKYNRMVRVEGHTDNDPINNYLYPSNWELSTARAVNVVKFFIEQVSAEVRLNPGLMQAAGYGEYKPIAPNDTAENKSKNRRIEIVILKNISE